MNDFQKLLTTEDKNPDTQSETEDVRICLALHKGRLVKQDASFHQHKYVSGACEWQTAK